MKIQKNADDPFRQSRIIVQHCGARHRDDEIHPVDPAGLFDRAPLLVFQEIDFPVCVEEIGKRSAGKDVPRNSTVVNGTGNLLLNESSAAVEGIEFKEIVFPEKGFRERRTEGIDTFFHGDNLFLLLSFGEI